MQRKDQVLVVGWMAVSLLMGRGVCGYVYAGCYLIPFEVITDIRASDGCVEHDNLHRLGSGKILKFEITILEYL